MERLKKMTGWGSGVLALLLLPVSCPIHTVSPTVDSEPDYQVTVDEKEGRGVISLQNSKKMTGWGSGSPGARRLAGGICWLEVSPTIVVLSTDDCAGMSAIRLFDNMILPFMASGRKPQGENA
ncbi:MAG: hypothetical protein DRQ40_06960 [Gammaproteobacteria bacterium]|nr:MAG: hypothetical protein DRQ40_06960 [Gammaproteobacteria bacterium]